MVLVMGRVGWDRGMERLRGVRKGRWELKAGWRQMEG